MSQSIYLDNNTTTKPSQKAIAKMLPFFTERWGTPSAPHFFGQEVLPVIEEALRGIYALLGAREKDTLVFTSSAAEGINHLIFSTYFDVTLHTGKNQFITSMIEEAPAIMAMGRLEKLNCVTRMASPDKQGRVTAEAIADMMTPRTALVSLTWANALTGVVNPIQEIAALCQERGVLLHLNVTHALGKLVCDWEEPPAHFITFSGEGFHAPMGTGGLFIRGDVRSSAFILGGIEQAGYRAGNFSVSGLAALGQAAREAIDARDLLSMEVARLRTLLETEIVARVPEAQVLFKDQERLPHCTAIAFPGVVNEALLYLLNRKGLYACIGGGSNQQIGIILSASGIDEQMSNSAVSFALSRETTEDEVQRAAEIVAQSVQSLRKVSQQWSKATA